jgi:hypothetical protein
VTFVARWEYPQECKARRQKLVIGLSYPDLPHYGWAPRGPVARCGRPRCNALLAEGLLEDENRIRFKAWMVYDRERESFVLSARAAKQWARARQQGEPWSEYWPRGRDPRTAIRASDGTVDPRPEKMPAVIAVLPVRARCPLCTWPNVIHPPSANQP